MSEVRLDRVDTEHTSEALLDIVFVHGLGGDATSTWYPAGEPGKFWPKWLADDIPTVRVWSLGYPAGWSTWFADASGMGILERSRNILQYLVVAGLGDRPLIFIAHSLGGLMVKQLLRTASSMQQPEWGRLLAKVQGVLFLATPHTGSGLANVATALSSTLRLSKLSKELGTSGAFLRDLGDWFRQNAGPLKLQVGAYYESDPTKGLAFVVDAISANPGVAGCVPVAVDGDHFTVSKPSSRQSLIYLSVKKFINSFLGEKPWRLYCVPGYSPREHTMQALLEKEPIWSISTVITQDSCRLKYSLKTTPLNDDEAHIFVIDLAAIAERSEIECMIELIALVRLQGRQLTKKPVFVLLGNEEERAAVFAILRQGEREALKLYFRLEPAKHEEELKDKLLQLQKSILQEWLVRPTSSPSSL